MRTYHMAVCLREPTRRCSYGINEPTNSKLGEFEGMTTEMAHLEISLRRSMTVGIRLIASAIRRHRHAGRQRRSCGRRLNTAEGSC